MRQPPQISRREVGASRQRKPRVTHAGMLMVAPWGVRNQRKGFSSGLRARSGAELLERPSDPSLVVTVRRHGGSVYMSENTRPVDQDASGLLHGPEHPPREPDRLVRAAAGTGHDREGQALLVAHAAASCGPSGTATRISTCCAVYSALRLARSLTCRLHTGQVVVRMKYTSTWSRSR